MPELTPEMAKAIDAWLACVQVAPPGMAYTPREWLVAQRAEIARLRDELAIMNGRRIACMMVSETDEKKLAALRQERDVEKRGRELAGIMLGGVAAQRDALVRVARAADLMRRIDLNSVEVITLDGELDAALAAPEVQALLGSPSSVSEDRKA